MTTIFAQAENAIEGAVQVSIDDLEQFFVADVWPIIKGTLTYIEQNGEADLHLLAKAAFASLASAAEGAIVSGGSPAVITADAISAAVGTIVDQGKQIGQQIATGAATLALSMAAAEINAAQATTPVQPAAPAV